MVAELQVLNKIISSGDMSLVIQNGLNDEYFNGYRNEFNFIVNHYKKYSQTPDLATFIKVFPNFEVLEVHESDEYLLSELRRKKDERYLVANLNKTRELIINKKTEEAKELISRTASGLAAVAHLEAVDLLNDVSRFDEYADKCENFMKYYISTGFKELDQIIGGWDRKEEYATISARPGVGKTWILLKSITASVERGLNVGLYSGEMSANKIGYRFDTLMSHLSNGMITHGNSRISVEYKNYLDQLKSSHKGHLYVLTRDKIDGKATVDVLRGFIEKYDLDILFIDQHSLLDSAGNERTAHEKAASISKEIKILQTLKHIPIITVSQQNRSAIEDGKFAGTDNIANSDRISQDSTVVLFVSQKDGILSLHLAKSRDGGTDSTISYMVDFDKGLFEYIPPEETEETEYDISSPGQMVF